MLGDRLFGVGGIKDCSDSLGGVLKGPDVRRTKRSGNQRQTRRCQEEIVKVECAFRDAAELWNVAERYARYRCGKLISWY